QQFARDYPTRVRGLVLACTYAYNMLSRRERVEGMLAPWLVRILGMRRLARLLFSGVGGGQRLPPETARWLPGILSNRSTLACKKNERGALLSRHAGEVDSARVLVALDPAASAPDGLDQGLLALGVEQQRVDIVLLEQRRNIVALAEVDIVAPLFIGVQLDPRVDEHRLLGRWRDRV